MYCSCVLLARFRCAVLVVKLIQVTPNCLTQKRITVVTKRPPFTRNPNAGCILLVVHAHKVIMRIHKGAGNLAVAHRGQLAVIRFQAGVPLLQLITQLAPVPVSTVRVKTLEAVA